MHESIMEYMEKLFPEESVTILIEEPKGALCNSRLIQQAVNQELYIAPISSETDWPYALRDFQSKNRTEV